MGRRHGRDPRPSSVSVEAADPLLHSVRRKRHVEMYGQVGKLEVAAFFGGAIAHEEPAWIRLVLESFEALLDRGRIFTGDVGGHCPVAVMLDK